MTFKPKDTDVCYRMWVKGNASEAQMLENLLNNVSRNPNFDNLKLVHYTVINKPTKLSRDTEEEETTAIKAWFR